MLPTGKRQAKVIKPVRERLAIDADPERRAIGKVRQALLPGRIVLAEDHLSLGSVRSAYARGVLTSVPDLRRKLMRYIRQYIKAPKTRSRPRRAIFHPVVASHQCIAPDVVHRRPFARSCVHG